MIYHFLDFELDEEKFEIRRAGGPVLTQRKAFDLVHHLLLHRDRVVTHDELIDALWGGAARSLSTVPQCAASVRRALGDDTRRQAVIQTVRGRGYRFVADVAESGSPSPSAVRSARDAHRSEGISKPRFVGRHELMSALRAALDESLSGEARVVLLEGEPGIGKTRVVEELSREAAESGVTVLTGRCHEGEGAPAFWPWIQTIRGWARLNAGKPIPDGLEAEVAFFASWLPENMAQATDPLVKADGAEARFRAFDTAGRGLQAFAKHTPLVLVLEDMHWADPASLGLLSFVGAQLHHDPILVLGTYREKELHSTPELFQTLAELARNPTFRRLSIGGLELDCVAELLAQIVGRDVSPALAESVAALTEGNPFFVVEIARILGAEGSGLESGDLAEKLEIQLPASISDTIGRRLGRLSAGTRGLLSVASTIGREFGTTLLSETAGTEHVPVFELLEEAASIGIIEPAQSSPDAYRFSHALIRETLYQGIRGPNRVRLHRAIAEALERLHGDSATVPLAALAHHWYQAVATGAVEKAAEYCERAGLQAASMLAFEEAVLHLRRALGLADLRPSSDESERCELLLHLGRAEWSAGEQANARATFARAAVLARQVDSAPYFALAAIGFYGFEEGITADATIRRLLEEAAERIAADSPALRARVLTKLQHVAPHAYSMKTRRSISLEALDLARSCGDIEALREAFRGRANATTGPDTLDERLEWEEECRSWGKRLGDPWLSWFGNDIASPVSRGDRDGVLHALRQSSLFADAMPGNRLSGFVGALQQAGFALMEGRFDDLRRFIGQIDAAGQGCVTWAPEASLGYLFLESWETGKIGRLEQDWLQFFERVIAGFEGRATIGHTCVALIRAFGGSREAALSELDWILGPDFAGREQNESWIYSMHLVADVIEYLETEPHAEVLSSALEPFAEQIACHSSFRWSGGSIASALGLLSSVRGDFEAGEIQFEAGIASEEALGAKPAGLRSRAGLARMLLRRGERDDRPRALALMEEVVKGCERLGIDPRARYVAPFERLSQ